MRARRTGVGGWLRTGTPIATTPRQTTQQFTPPLHGKLVGENHHPRVNAKWTYTVTVHDARGRKLTGTETTQYTFNGVVVGTEKPVNVRFTNGVYRDTIEFPAAAAGHPLNVQAVVHTAIGSITLRWPITVGK